MTARTTSPRERLYQAPRAEPELVQIPELDFIMIDGQGDPNTSQAYRDAIEVLYALSYTLKFALKKDEGVQYRVGPLEGLWWADQMTDFSVERKDGWKWTMMIGQPDGVTPERFAHARAEVARKKGLPALELVRHCAFEEGLCAQVLHLGPFSAEGPTIAKLHAFIRTNGFVFDGQHQKHHEIYLSDPRRSAPEKWRTVLRQPVSTGLLAQ